MTGVGYYRDLLAETPRIEAFRRAVGLTVAPGDTVLDVGCGLGTFAFFAADAGASRVWAVDGSPIVHVASEVSRDNGYGSRVQFLRGWLPAITLPEPADVVLFEDFPARLLDAASFRVLRSVRERYATPTARWIPAAADLFVAPVGGAAVPSDPSGDRRYGIDWTASEEYARHEPRVLNIAPAALLASPARAGRVCLGEDMAAGYLGGAAEFTLTASGPIRGLAFWFDLELATGIRLSNAPGATPGSWGHLFLPLEEPLHGAPGDTLRASVEPHSLPDGAPGWLRWEVEIAGESRRGYELAGIPASFDDLAAASPDHVPALNDAGRLALRILRLANGGRTIREIAEAVAGCGNGRSRAEVERLVVETLRDRMVRPAGSWSAGEDTAHEA